MLTINKLRPDHVLDYAAEELKKYIRMMQPDGGDVDIAYAPNAVDGFRLGLLEDFGLPNEAEDPVVDDVVHVDAGRCAYHRGNGYRRLRGNPPKCYLSPCMAG